MVTTEDGFYGGVSFPYTKPWIAAYGGDVFPGAGTLSYQEFSDTDTAQMTYATQLVKEVYKGDVNFTADYAFAVTWSDVIVDGDVSFISLMKIKLKKYWFKILMYG